jgi:hypothetical protein
MEVAGWKSNCRYRSFLHGPGTAPVTKEAYAWSKDIKCERLLHHGLCLPYSLKKYPVTAATSPSDAVGACLVVC